LNFSQIEHYEISQAFGSVFYFTPMICHKFTDVGYAKALSPLSEALRYIVSEACEILTMIQPIKSAFIFLKISNKRDEFNGT